MTHLLDTRLDAYLFDAVSLTQDESAHVDACPICRARFDAGILLRDELQIARRSQPTPAQTARYARLFVEEHSQSVGQRLASLLQSLRLGLVLDTRQAAPALGVRGVAGFGHRLLYSSDQVDVELLLEPEGANWYIDGDVLPFEPDSITAPYLVELQGSGSTAQSSAALRYHVESATSGRFRLMDIPPGQYDLSLTPARGPAIEIPGLSIP